MSIAPAPLTPDDRLIGAATAWLRALLVPPPMDEVVPVPGPSPEIPPGEITAMLAATTTRPVPSTGNKREPQPRAWYVVWYDALMRPFRREDVIPALVVPARQPERDEREIRHRRRELEQALEAAPESRFVRFCRTFGLSPFERDVLLLLFVHAINTEIARRCARMPESINGHPTFALSLALAGDPTWSRLPQDYQEDIERLAAPPAWDALSPERPLRAWRIVEIAQQPGQPLVSSPLRLDERIVNHLMGLDYPDDRIARWCQPVALDPARDQLSGSQAEAIEGAVRTLQVLAAHRSRLLVQMPGRDAATKRLYAVHLAGRLGFGLYRVPLDQLAQEQAAGEFAWLWNRERRLQPVALVIDAGDALGPASHLPGALDGLVFLDAPEPVPGQDTALLLDVSRPTPLEQRDLWLEVLGEDGDEWAERLAGQFNLNVGEIAEAIELAGDDARGEAIWARHRSRGRARLDGLAQRIASATRLDDVQLPDDEKRMLEQIRDQTRHRMTVYDLYGFRPVMARGLGISALFAGESGTGKTMAAEALANELELDLYRIDLASVVSKYIGETEKNLKRLFDAAEQSGAVLLFDEADAIFGKRSEVQDSHDRYANIEVSYLLQRMEAYEGLAILTTNMKSALDQAFLRRLRFIVTFPFPGLEQRRKIWERIFPRVTGDTVSGGLLGIDALDLEALAGPALTGGQIRNIAVNAAFLAAAGDGVITMDLLRAAARDELRKNGRPFAASDFAAWTTPEDGQEREAS